MLSRRDATRCGSGKPSFGELIFDQLGVPGILEAGSH
jgi:hypothetical protein